MVDQLRILARIPDCACFDIQILGPKRNLDHRSFFSLDRCVTEFIQFFSNKTHLNSGVRLLLELLCVIVIKHVALFNICAKLLVTINGIHIYLSGCKLYFFEQKFWRIGEIAYPYSPPLPPYWLYGSKRTDDDYRLPSSCSQCAVIFHLHLCASLSTRPQKTRNCSQLTTAFFFQGDSLITVCKYRSGEDMISVCGIGDPYLEQ